MGERTAIERIVDAVLKASALVTVAGVFFPLVYFAGICKLDPFPFLAEIALIVPLTLCILAIGIVQEAIHSLFPENSSLWVIIRAFSMLLLIVIIISTAGVITGAAFRQVGHEECPQDARM